MDSTLVRPFVLDECEQPGIPMLFTINGEQWPDNKPVHVMRGDVEIWRVQNNAPMDRPFHVHGMFFQLLSEVRGSPVFDG